MIEIKNLYKRYHNHHGSEWVLRDINLTIPTGVSVGLIGANGAGKSTLLRLIAGMDTPERGEVIRHSRVSWPIGLSGGMQGSMTGRQNVKFVARVQGHKNIEEIVAFVEKFSEIGYAFDEPVKTYSSGMKSRISFGLSLAFNFDVYISDEATAVGDRAFKSKAKKLFKDRINKSSLIMVSHSEGILKDLCTSGIYIKSGKAVWFDDINKAIESYHQDIEGPKEVNNNYVSMGHATNVDPQITKEHVKWLGLAMYILKEIQAKHECADYIEKKYEQRKASLPKEVVFEQPKINLNNLSQLLKQINRASKALSKEIRIAKNTNNRNNSILALKESKLMIKQYREKILRYI